MCKVQISAGKNRDKKSTAKNLFGPADNILLVLKVYFTILHLTYQLSMYKLAFVGVAAETTSTTHCYLTIIHWEENCQLFLCYEVLNSHGEQYTALGDEKIMSTFRTDILPPASKKFTFKLLASGLFQDIDTYLII